MRTFAEVFHAHQGRLVDKWEHYFPIYDKHLSKYQDKPVRVLEIGVSHGGSLQIWKEYLGGKALIWGIDIDQRCSDYANEPRIYSLTVDQSDSEDLASLADTCGPFDIVIDDGSHLPAHQCASFRALWPYTTGSYLVEDCHDGYPVIDPKTPGALVSYYHWIMVIERPKRLIRGTPSREMREDELEAQRLHPDL